MLTTSQKQKIEDFHKFILRWGKKNGRSFIWRGSPTPYKVLIAEIFLQRTNALQAEKQYIKFIKKYKNFHVLNNTRSADLNKFLFPLGLKKRMGTFKRMVSVINKKYNGRVPMDYSKLISLPGIGDYAASAVLLFAGKERRGLVDANTIRIFSKLFNKKICREDGKRSKFIRNCSDYFSSMGKKPREANWYLLDYGAKLLKKT